MTDYGRAPALLALLIATLIVGLLLAAWDAANLAVAALLIATLIVGLLSIEDALRRKP